MQVVSQQYGMHIFRDSAVMNDFLFAGLFAMVRTSLATLTNEACLGRVMRVSRLGSYSSIHLLVPRYGSEGTLRQLIFCGVLL